MKKYKPLVDRLYWTIFVTLLLILIAVTIAASFSHMALYITLPLDLIVVYLLVSPLFGYIELREETLYIKYGLILKKEIPYSKIREAVKSRGFYCESMLSLKNAFEHVNIKYNSFDITSVSVVGNDDLIDELNDRILNK